MKSSLWIAPVVLIALLLTAGCSTDQNAAELRPPEETLLSGPEIAGRAVEAYDPLEDFSATVTLMWESATERERIVYQPPDRYRVEYLKRGDIVVFDGEKEWHLVNATNEVLWVSADYVNFTFPEDHSTGAIDYLELLLDMLANNEWTLNGTSSVNGTTLYIIENKSATRIADAPNPAPYAIYSVRVWIEDGSWTIRRAESFSRRGYPVLAAEYSDIVINGGVPENAFVFHPPEGAVVQPMRTVCITPPADEIPDAPVTPVW